MAFRRKRWATVGAVALAAAVAFPSSAAFADDDSARHHGDPPGKGKGPFTTVQLLSFNDYHGHLEATDVPLTKAQDPAQNPVGGVEYLATNLAALRAKVGKKSSLTVAAGDLIGGSPFLSGMFHDEPSVESLNALGLDVSSVGNHEFDEGTAELLRMQKGGCHPVAGCYFPDAPYAGAKFQWLAANVIRKDNGKSLLPATSIKEVNGEKIGFIGMTLKATPTLVSPAGVATVDFKDEVETANRQAVRLRKEGVKAIVVLIHEGGYQTGEFGQCLGISEPIYGIASKMSPEIDMIISGHTHQPYVCSIPDPAGKPRLVTSAADYGRAITETSLVIDRRTGDVDRAKTTAVNHLNVRTVAPDPKQTAIIAKWTALAGPIKNTVVGSHVEDILGDASGNRGIETPMGAVVADSILWGTAGPAKGNAQISFMNIGGVRSSLRLSPPTGTEGIGQITYQEAYNIAPFGNLLVTMDMTGDQIRQVLEQQYQPVPARGSRPMLALAVSEGFSYSWDALAPQGSRVVAGSMKLNGVPLDLAATYRVGTLNFLADGGDLFTAFTQGKNRLGGPEDLANLVEYFKNHPGLKAPVSRIDGL